MDNLINRQMAIDAVCMEWCSVKHQDCEHPFDVGKDDYYWCDGCETALRTLPDLPSAEPEIIRCKDCRWWEQESICEGHCLEIDLHHVDEDHYCSFAERRADAAD